MDDPDINAGSRRAAVIGILAGIILTVPAFLLAIFSSGAGHGDYAFARAVFPVPMLLTFNEAIGPLSLLAAGVQLPLYGGLIGQARVTRRYRTLALALGIHLLAGVICFSGTLPNFS